MKRKHIGSDFEDFLKEHGDLEEATAIAIKRIIAWEFERAMKAKRMSKTTLAAKMRTSRAQVNRLLNAKDPSLTLTTIASAANALGRRIKFELKAA